MVLGEGVEITREKRHACEIILYRKKVVEVLKRQSEIIREKESICF